MQYARQRLRELSPRLTYHSLWHTWHDVLPAVDRLITLEYVSGEDALLLRTAAIYHDIGFVVQVADHEMIGAQIATYVLPRLGYTLQQIDRVYGMIMATRLPQSPKNLLEQILADADLDVLGRDDFWPRNKALRAECAAMGKRISDTKWCACQSEFLQSHRYFTASARALRNAQKQRNIAFLRGKLAKSKSC
ncbi:MAG: HD domain-containing protein [Anaerolineae bacterium]|nr:HD domain-containing protein [Anaerolineae bacterium]